jgi:hypothetical protein
VTHEEAIELLHELQLGRLEDDRRRELEQHLAECEDCQGFVETFHALRGALGRAEEEQLPEEAARALEKHLSVCPSCRGEGAATGDREEAASPPTRPRRASQRRWERVVTAVAAALVLVLAYPAYVGLFGTAERARSAVEGGAVTLQTLRSEVRGEGVESRVRVEQAQPALLLGVEMAVPQEIRDAESLRFAFHDPEGRRVTEITVRVATARRHILKTGVVTLLVPAEMLPDRVLTLIVTRGEETAGDAIFETDFEVVRDDL